MFFVIKNEEYKNILGDRLIELGYTRAVNVFLNNGTEYLQTNSDGFFTYLSKIPDNTKINILDELYKVETGKRFVTHMGRIQYTYGFD